MSWQLAKRLWLVPMLLALGVGAVQSRELREMCLEERIKISDSIFVGKVVALAEPDQKMAGVNKYAQIEVQKVLKGKIPKRTRFVVSGYSAELNPACCEADETYIFFSKAGYDVFGLSEGSISVSTLGADEFQSAVNGRFSTFLLRGDEVVGWRAARACGEYSSSSMADALSCIHEQVQRQNPTKEEKDPTAK